MKRVFSTVIALLLMLAVLPAGAKDAGTRYISTDTVIDVDGSDGYSGDYVVIYNPSTQVDNTKSTGDMTGLINTTVEQNRRQDEPNGSDARAAERVGRMMDVDSTLADEARRMGIEKPDMNRGSKEPLSFEVGDTHVFYVTWYSPLPNHNIEFKVLAKGEHCYIWTPVSDDPNAWPLDSLDPDYAQDAADVFDSKFDLMLASFGEHYNGAYGDGRLNLLFYNIDDGWDPQSSSSYIGGYFYSYDYVYNEMPILNIDTWPTIHFEYSDGTVTEDISYIYNVMMHEYQHLINYSRCGYTDNMVNEMMSAAAEEICFPGSSVLGRILSWTNYYETGGYDLLDPPEEVEYIPEYPLENGFSLFDWDSESVDILVLYAQVSLFSQYLYTHYGNGFFLDLMNELADGWPTVNALENAAEKDATLLAEEFRVALTANTAPHEFEGKYGFIPQAGYDPAEYYGIQSPYDLLCPVVFTGSRCSISGAGAICVKPVNGVYYPPSGADPGLKYFGVTRNAEPQLTPGDVDGSGAVNANDALLALRASLGLVALTPKQQAAADVDGSGDVTAIDALTILRSVLGLTD